MPLLSPRMRLPPVGAAVPRRGNRLSRGLGRVVLLSLGWRVEGEVPDRPKLVAILAPHTSNWDFVVGLSAILALGLDVRWLGKHTLFRPPFRRLLRWLGGTAVDREDAADVVQRAIAAFHGSDRLFLGLSPEGTRRKVEKWKSGFHRIAWGAGVPILLCSLDYRTRVVQIGPLFAPTGDFEADVEAIGPRFSAAMARYPEMF